MTLGEKIIERRKMENLSQNQLAEKLSVSRSAVAKWESDKGLPDIENLKVLSRVLNISIDSLLENEDKTEEIQNQEAEGSLEEAFLIKRDEKIATYINKRCTVELTDYNDGIDGYLISQDKDYLYYVRREGKKTIIGALGKKFIEQIQLSKKKEETDLNASEYMDINRTFFIGKNVSVALDEKHFWSGLIGFKETEYLNVVISGFSEANLTIENKNALTDILLPVEKITKIEVIV
ncbi:MAG: helix-turn-helix transcriptional regulator [Lachnospiraceae bacterium]|nr:helix-turn-helix transcriptional regulator [Lachnospiraceae bacterium]